MHNFSPINSRNNAPIEQGLLPSVASSPTSEARGALVRTEAARADSIGGSEGAVTGVRLAPRSAIQPPTHPSQTPPPTLLYDVKALVDSGALLKQLAETLKAGRSSPEVRRHTAELEEALSTGKPDMISVKLEALKSNRGLVGVVIGRVLMKNIQNRKNNDLLIEVSQKHFPEINKLLVQLSDRNQKTLSVEGFEIIISLLKAKGKLDTSCELCIGEKEFFHKFLTLIQGNEQKKAFIIRNGGEKNRLDAQIHYCYVMVEKGNPIRIFIFDSLGTKGYGVSYPSSLSDILRRECPSAKADIYNATYVRQQTAVGCPIFALRDLIHLTNYVQARQFILSHSEPSKEGAGDGVRNHHDIHTLPSPMMKYTQNVPEIEEYQRKQATDPASPQAAMSILQQLNSKQHIRKIAGKEGDFNRIVADRYQKYTNFLIALAIAHGTLIQDKKS
ncbi:MAG: hypothetical protein LLG04_15725 [Parachlamydia sp.]|nr:hypothetical protein [Parachlamydia sp.]